MRVAVSTSLRGFFSAVVLVLLLLQGCKSKDEDPNLDPVSEISMYDRLRLTLADADVVGIHLFDLKQMRADILTLKETDPELSDLLISDLDRVEAVPKTDVKEKARIGRDMYARFKTARKSAPD